MSQETPQESIARKTVLFRLPGMDEVRVRRDLAFPGADGETLQLDLYAPPGATGRQLPAVVIGEGYPEAGFRRLLGCSFREMGPIASWARLIAASGMVAVVGSNREPAADARALLRFVRDDAATLGIDAGRIGLWAASGNAPVALLLLLGEGRDFLRCAVFCYPFLLDLDGATHVAEAAAAFRFVDACAGRSMADFPAATPIFLARAGQEETPHLDESLDRFVARARERNLPLTLVDHAEGPHAFDLFHDSAETRAIVGRILEFLRSRLLA
jgi:hypothetical protein